MKHLFLIPAIVLGFIACGGESLSQSDPNEDYLQQVEQLKKQKEAYTPHALKSYQSVTAPRKLAYYYQSVDFTKNGSALAEDLAVLTITKHTNILDYGQRHPYLEKANADAKKAGNVLLVYSGESRPVANIQKRNNPNGDVNTEHIYPQSYLKKYNSTDYTIGDLHHLQYVDSRENSSRGNLPFSDGKGRAHNVGKAWYPSDEFKGDVARMVLYMFLRYNLPFHHVSTDGVGLFLKWNAEDPVSALELQRNNEIEAAQGNRNPFIDNPYLATKIFGEVPNYSPENSWK